MDKKFIVARDYHNTRFDRWFRQNIQNVPQSFIEKLIRKKNVKLNNKRIKTSHRVKFNDTIQIYGITKLQNKNEPKNIKYKPSQKEKKGYDNLIIEDNSNFLVINKPSGVPVQGGTKSFRNIIDIIKNTKYFEETKPYIVHRLDKETSGVMIIAKNREYAQLFTSLFRIRKIHKTYLAVTHDEVGKEINILQDDLITYDKNKKKIQKAISYVKVIKSNNKYSLLELRPITGRKHQLRKQLYNIGNPIVGDDRYYIKKTKKISKNQNLMLHAYKVKFMINSIKYNFEAKYSEKFNNFINKNIKS